jgi:hypothetical protein
MKCVSVGNARLATGAFLCVMAVSAFLLLGCSGKAENRFSAQSYDEYTEPLSNALIGTPTGTIVIGSADAGPVPIGGGGGGPPDGGIPIGDGGLDGGSGGGFGFWHFDDCSAASHFLIDSSGGGANAQHALNGACVPGISGLGVGIRSAKDVIQVPDEPQFTVDSRVAVAAWVHPNTVGGHQPIVIKRLNNQTSFSLGIHDGNIEMSVVLTTGQTIISRAPIAAGTWSHVAGMYDGTFVFLFINGQQFGQIYAAGTLRDVFAPIRMGATTQTQHFDGIIDEVFLSTQAITKDELTALACISKPSTFTVNPAKGGPVQFDTTVHYDVAVTNNDTGFCQPAQYDIFFNFFRGFDGGGFDPTIQAVFDPPSFAPNVQPGATVTFGAEVTPTIDTIPGEHRIPFDIDRFSKFGPGFQQLFGDLTLEVAAPTGCVVFTRRELMITSTSVVDDPIRTSGVFTPGFDGGTGFIDASPGSSGGGKGVPTVPPPPPPIDASQPVDAGANPSQGVWTFGHLMREMAPTPEQAPALTLALFQHWLTDQTINGFTVPARRAIQQVLLDIWPKTPAGELDLDQPPLRLQAIVNRIDLRDLSVGSAGEGRIVFAVNGPFFPQQFTVILEYNLPAKTQQDVQDWANLWHGLSSHPFPSEEYNAALEAITLRFSGRNAAPGAPNGSALLSLRTNEFALSTNNQWELREFVLSPTTGFFDETPVEGTPDLRFNGTATFADFVNQNAPAIIAVVPGGAAHVPTQFAGQSFLAGSAFNDNNFGTVWSAPGITNPEARFHASINTCNGCHSNDTNTFFLQINPRSPGSEAFLSPFLTGTTVFDRGTGIRRTLNDLARRRTDLTGLVCPTDAGLPPPVDSGPPPPPFDAGPPPPIVDAGLPD